MKGLSGRSAIPSRTRDWTTEADHGSLSMLLFWGPDLSIGGLRQTPVVAIDRGLFYPPAEAPTLTDSIPAPRSRGADDEDLSLPFLGEKSRKLRFLRSVHTGHSQGRARPARS